ncbi:MAG: helix-turn-helix domain-containing protein [Bacteroidota bacterium]
MIYPNIYIQIWIILNAHGVNYLAKNLTFLIKRFDTTQSELALYVGVSQNSISNWINEISHPNAPALLRLYQFFGISLDALLMSDLKNGKVITDAHVEDFKRNGKVTGNVIGKVHALSKEYFSEDNSQLNMKNEPDPVASWAIMGQLKKITEKIDLLQVSVDSIPKTRL